MKMVIIGLANDGTKENLNEKAIAYLADLAGVEVEEFERKLPIINLFGDVEGALGRNDVRERANDVIKKLDDIDQVLLTGRTVSAAFGFPSYVRSMTWREVSRKDLDRELMCAYLPQPSGRNPWYSPPRNRQHAKEFLRKVLDDASVDEHDEEVVADDEA